MSLKMQIILSALIGGISGCIVIEGILLAISYMSKRITEHITRQGETEEENEDN